MSGIKYKMKCTFIDGYSIEVYEYNASTARVRAAYERMISDRNACTRSTLTVDSVEICRDPIFAMDGTSIYRADL